MLPAERIEAYFQACGEGTAAEIAAHFTDDAVVYDTNIKPMRGAQQIGVSWVKVRERWNGARWTVDSFVGDGDVAAIEWSMTGTAGDSQSGFRQSGFRQSGFRQSGFRQSGFRQFVFRGSEHYRFGTGNLISEIRQYWTFDPKALNTGLVDYDYF